LRDSQYRHQSQLFAILLGKLNPQTNIRIQFFDKYRAPAYSYIETDLHIYAACDLQFEADLRHPRSRTSFSLFAFSFFYKVYVPRAKRRLCLAKVFEVVIYK